MTDSFQLLGTGASAGVPVIGCSCRVCTSSSPFDKRLRSGAVLKAKGKTILIDAGPDFRQQALTCNINRVDGVIFTHTHFDHIAGIDDLRIYFFLQNHKLPCLVSKDTLEELKKRYFYLFGPAYENKSLGAQLEFDVLEQDFGKINFQGVALQYLSYFQGGMKVTGIRYKDFAYVTDIKEYSEEVFEVLKGVKTLVVSALRYTPSPVHFTVDDAITFAQKVGATQTYFTHIAHDLIHDETCQKLPSGFALGYDGLEIHF